MKKLVYFLFLVVMIPIHTYCNATNVVVQLEDQKQEKMKLLFGLIDFPESMDEFVSIVCNDLSCHKQKKSGFSCGLRKFDKVPSKTVLKNIAQDGYMMVIFLQKKSHDGLEWRVYDSMQTQMYCGKRMALDFNDLEMAAHRLSDSLWKIFTGQDGIFSSRIAYCCQKTEGSHSGSDLYIQSPYAEKAHCVVQGGKLLAPRWNKNSKNPLLFFSELTPSNIRLVSSTLQGKKKIVSNFDGITMLPSFSSNGENVVYCATHPSGTSQLYHCSIDKKNKKKRYRIITHNNGNNTSPNLRDNGDVIFCSDAETKTPQIYYWHAGDDRLEPKTKSGYCSSPNFSEKTGKIAFLKLVGNIIQIFSHDLATEKEEQVTYTHGNKDECCWSPCGNYLAYSVEKGKESRIALYNMITKEETFITDPKLHCSYPSWSPKI